MKTLETAIEEFENLSKKEKEPEDQRVRLGQKLVLAESVFIGIEDLKKEKAKIESQQYSMEKIYLDFVAIQKKEMELFLSTISSDMNGYFQFMNPNDNIGKIEFKTISGCGDDFTGLSYNLAFRGTPLEAPKMYLSESYLNCLGLCLFLASVNTFNKKNQFFILDDVVSSFDKNHRTLFARLLVEKFKERQILVFTHEEEWFAILGKDAKSQNWVIQETIWNSATGTFIREKAVSLKDIIDEKFLNSDPVGLGNLLGRYTESLLKELCENLEAHVAFRSNSRNENRSFEELFSGVTRRLKDKKTGLDKNSILENLSLTQFFRNKTSHGNGFGENIADMNVCYADLQAFESLFTCSETGGRISTKFVDPAGKRIQTKSGKLSYTWD